MACVLEAVTKPKNRWSRLFRTIPEVFRAALEEKADLYHFHDPELIPLGIWFKTMGRRVVYDVHEDVPRQIASKPYIARWVRPLLSAGASLSESICAQIVDGIVAATPEIARALSRQEDRHSSKLSDIGRTRCPPVGPLPRTSFPYRLRGSHCRPEGSERNGACQWSDCPRARVCVSCWQATCLRFN